MAGRHGLEGCEKQRTLNASAGNRLELTTKTLVYGEFHGLFLNWGGNKHSGLGSYCNKVKPNESLS